MSEVVQSAVRSEDADTVLADLIAEITDRLHAGQRVDVQAYLARCPERAQQLGRLLPALELLDGLKSQSSHGDAIGPEKEVPADERVAGVLGDFRIIREIGKGGMGVVYEAEQMSLRRRVALKVLPFAATMDPRHLQRFHNEARAAATLHHTNIVPVYFVGCERGVHFYAMQFIEGQSLDAFLRQLRQDAATAWTAGSEPAAPSRGPSPGMPAAELAETRVRATTQLAPRDAAYCRRVAAWGIAAAEALEHAHSLGIVHRDIKPANLMIDGAGKLWVTDFGLARTVSDASLTLTGDLLGTLRYMSPEQALAKHDLLDYRTDVYSLGITLYELLTLRPAIDGKDREEVLQKIAFEEPSLPHRLNELIPTDLETILLKAMAKEPAERYATAQELADDLRHFLEDRPIRAKRQTVPQRLKKWGLRHRHLLGLSMMFLVLIVVGLGASAFLLWREKEQTRTALAEARAHSTRAEIQRQRAEANFREAFWAIEDLLCAFDPERSAQPVTVGELRQWQTEMALHFLTPFCEDTNEEPAVRLQKGAAHIHIGRVYQVLGEGRKAQEAFRQAVAVFERLVQDFPEDPTYPRELATALRIAAEDLYQGGWLPSANVYASQAVSVWREAIRKHPGDVQTHLQLATMLCCWFDPQLRDPNAAVELARKVIELAPDDPHSWLALGLAYYRDGQWGASHTALHKALQAPEVPRKWGWTHALFVLAMAQWQCGRREEAMQAYWQAVQRMEKSFRARDSLDRAIQAEAAALLGVSKQPISPKQGGSAP